MIAVGYTVVLDVVPIAGAGRWGEVIGDLAPAGLIYGVGNYRFVMAFKWLLLGRYHKRAAPMWTPFVWLSEGVTNMYEVIDGKPTAIGVSISHAGALSVAAFNPAGAIGIDLMQVTYVADWARVAHDYLGMATAFRLIAMQAADLPRAFAQAWCEREAHLKLIVKPLAEWTPSPADCRLFVLALPEGFAGAVAV